MPLTFVVGQKVIATAVESDASGTAITPSAASLEWTGSDPTIATVETNPDGTATIAAVTAGSISLTVKDNANDLTTTDTLIITATATGTPTAGKPTSIAITYGVPA